MVCSNVQVITFIRDTHPFYEKYKQSVKHHLDLIIETQQADGCGLLTGA